MYTIAYAGVGLMFAVVPVFRLGQESIQTNIVLDDRARPLVV